jgi:hypothetical protein
LPQPRRMPLLPTPRRELVAAGADVAAINGDLRAGRTVAVFRGVHVDAAGAAGFVARVRSAAATQDVTAVVAMQTSAVLLGCRWLPREWSADEAPIHMAIARTASRRHRDGLRIHWRLVEPVDRVLVNGIACMSAARTLVELARDPEIPPLLVVQIIDGALRFEQVTKDELLACVARFPGERGIARARRLVGRAREGVDSPQETRMRLMLEDGGITELDVNIPIHDDGGDVLARGDLGIKRLLIWGEYDGFDSHTERETFRNDRPRLRWIQRRGWQTMGFADADLWRPAQTCAEWRAAIAEAPARIRALDPSRSPEVAAAWRALGFPS